MTYKADGASFTVAICTRNRARELGLCLEALFVSVGGLDVKVVVVDNGSTDGTADVCRRFVERHRLTVLDADKVGLSHARNVALASTRSDYIVYLDDDAKPFPGWAAAIARGVGRWTPDFFGGPVVPYYDGPRPAWFLDDFGSNHLDLSEGLLPTGTCLTGCNMGWRVELLRELGGFDESLGMVGGRLRLGEETALMGRAYRTRPSLRAVFLEDMRIEHLFHASRMNLPYMFKRSWTYGWQLHEIAPEDALLKRSSMRLLIETKLGLPLLVRPFVRDRAVAPYFRSFAAFYLGRFGMNVGIVCRRLADRLASRPAQAGAPASPSAL